jgi:hypothetical protein
LANRYRLAHLVPGEPSATGDKLALHLPDESHGTAEANRPEAQKVANDLADPTGLCPRDV